MTGLPVENGGLPHIAIVLQELIVEFNFELFAIRSDLPVLSGIVLATPVKHQLGNLYMSMKSIYYMHLFYFHTWHFLNEFPEGSGLSIVGEYGRVPQGLLPLVRLDDCYGNIPGDEKT